MLTYHRFWFLLLACQSLSSHLVAVTAWQVVPPAKADDWHQLASLVCQTAWSPPPHSKNSGGGVTQPSSNNSVLHRLSTFWRDANDERETYMQYVTTARRMKDAKYALFVAKEDSASGVGVVVGAVEMGMQRLSSNNNRNHNNNDKEEAQGSSTNGESFAAATVGMICVDPDFRGQGIATALLERCEHVAAAQWHETTLYADVELGNDAALTLLERRGFQRCVLGSNDVDTGSTHDNDDDDKKKDLVVWVPVRRRRRSAGTDKVENRPHWRLVKRLQAPARTLPSRTLEGRTTSTHPP